MSQHSLQGRTEDEVLWFQRRSFLQAAAAWTSMGGFAAAQAQSRSNIVELRGDVLLNGQRMSPNQTVQSGDEILTGPPRGLIFVIGNAAFHVRQNSRLRVERGATLNTVSLLRLLTGAVVSVFGRGGNRAISRPHSPLASGAPVCTPRSCPTWAHLLLQLLRHGGTGTRGEHDGVHVELPPVVLGRNAARPERPGHHPRWRDQPHRRRAGVSGRSHQPAHRLADRGQKGKQGWRRLCTGNR